jgi:hypothetical protein
LKKAAIAAFFFCLFGYNNVEMLKFFGAAILLTGLFQPIPICRPLKENEAYRLKSLISVQIGSSKTIRDEIVEHRCTDIDEHGIEHITATLLEGTVKRGADEAESTKGDSYNYFQNSRGQRFEYEEIRSTLKDDPINFMIEQVHSKLKEYTILPGETWKGKSSHTEYSIVAGQPKQFMKTECIQVTRKGVFTNGITGEFKEDSWYRTSDGQLMYQQTTADNVVQADVPEIQFLERLEFLPEKS